MKKKTFFATILIIFLMLSFGACANKKSDKITFVVPDGAPALSVNLMLGKQTINKSTVTTNVVPSSQINVQALKNNIAIVPSNIAVKMFNSGKNIKILSVITSGNLYIVSSQPFQNNDLSELIGKKVVSIGQGSVPDLIFRKILEDKEIPYEISPNVISKKVAISYASDPSSIIPLLAKAKKDGEKMFGILGEPAVTTAISKGLYQAFDLQKIWQDNNQSEHVGFAQAVLIADEKVYSDPTLVNALLAKIQESIIFATNSSQEAVKNVKTSFGQTVLNNTMTADVVQRCNIDLKKIAGNRDFFDKTIKAVFDLVPDAIGNSMPTDSFYYLG